MQKTSRAPLSLAPVLVLGPDSRFQRALTRELRSLPAPVASAEDFDQAKQRAAALARPPSVVLLGESQIDTASFEAELAELRVRARAPRLIPIAFGRAPSEERRRALRAAGVELALFGRFGRHALRFQINHALSPASTEALRGALRAPQEWRTRTFSAGKEKIVRCYSLSAGGAYFVTPRPFVVGSEIQIELPIGPDKRLLEGRILYTHAAGSDDRRALPRGMAVEFQALSEDVEDFIRQGVTATQGGLRV